MATRRVEDFTDPYLSNFTRVPPVRDGVCRFCHAACPGYAQCASCLGVIRQVSHELELVVPVSMYEKYGQLHTVLRNYKDGTADAQARFTPQVAALLGRFMKEHRDCIARAAGHDFDAVTIVPSSRADGRTAHALETVLNLLPWVS